MTLDAGQSATVPSQWGRSTFADAGTMKLMAVATSQTDPAVQAIGSADISIATATEMTARFSPATQTLPQAGPATFLLEVNNTGNLEDSYTATITGTTGPIQASLNGLDGQLAQTVPIFILPGLSTGVLVLEVNLTGIEQGTVKVQVQSLTDPTIVTTATATVGVEVSLPVPTVSFTGPTSFTYTGQPEPASGTVTGANGVDLGAPTFTLHGQ